ncbi:MAG: aldose epimerase family protein [Betaproteobacteria bacterium]
MNSSSRTSVDVQPFGALPNGARAFLYTLRNGSGFEARITNYGASIVSILAPDRHGALADVVLGFDDFEGYASTRKFFGATVGRYANRIAGGRFVLGNNNYTLATNNGPNHLHGGWLGFDKAVWTAPDIGRKGVVLLRYRSVDGEEGYPGNLDAEVSFALTSDNALRIDYRATADRPTPVNLTNHSFFNLGGERDILGHEVKLFAERFTPVDDKLIPSGELRAVAGTPFDFREPVRIGARIDADDEQLARAGGYDHNFVLAKKRGQLAVAAEVYDRRSGRALRMLTTEPGVQFYSGNFLDGSITGKGGAVYTHRYGFCLEAQHFPDSPNQPHFPTTILQPGETYRQTTIYRFAAL